eukprot:449653-Pelagomonas_calceolata.AAC.3
MFVTVRHLARLFGLSRQQGRASPTPHCHAPACAEALIPARHSCRSRCLSLVLAPAGSHAHTKIKNT